MSNVETLIPNNNFSVVANAAANEIEAGIILGYTPEGDLAVFSGGLIDGRQPKAEDWLWIIEGFKNKLLNGDYFE